MTRGQKFSWSLAILNGACFVWSIVIYAIGDDDGRLGWALFSLLATFMSVQDAVFPVRATHSKELYTWRLTVNGAVVARGSATTPEQATRDLETAQQEHRP